MRDAGEPGPAMHLTNLDPDQRAAVTTASTLVAVIATAGSGKTRVLTSRIGHRVAVGSADARHTLALTFTREAAGELRRRVRRSGVREHVAAGTFHGIALMLLRQRWADLDVAPASVVNDRDRLLREAASGVAVHDLRVEADWVAARGVPDGDYVAAARRAGRRTTQPAERIGRALSAYAQLKRRRGVLDFGDLLADAVTHLAADQPWADAVRYRFRHLLVDEAQDLNPMQYRFLELLNGGRDDVFLVGDPAQAIYGFNGSDPSLLVDIADHLPGIEIIHLQWNHRSTEPIVTAGVHVLRRAGQESTMRSARGDGPGVRVEGVEDGEAEARFVIDQIHRLDPPLVRTSDVAVLARTNHLVGRMDDALVAGGVPILRRGLRPGTPLAATSRAVCALGSAMRLRAWAHDAMEPTAGGLDEDEEAVLAERRFGAVVLEFLREQPFGDGAALRQWITATNPFDEPTAAGVEVLTFHGAKGREWHTVFVTGVETGLVPHRSATTNAARAEEARLLHVALTRATDQLVITWAARRGGYRRSPSPLLDELEAGGAPAVPMPPELRIPVAPAAALDSLLAWRDEAARAAGILPEELCPDVALQAIAATSPHDAVELGAVAGFGPATATRLFAGIRAALDGLADQSRRSTTTGA